MISRIIDPVGIATGINASRVTDSLWRFWIDHNMPAIIRIVISRVRIIEHGIGIIKAIPVIIAVPWAENSRIISSVIIIIHHGIIIEVRPPCTIPNTQP